MIRHSASTGLKGLLLTRFIALLIVVLHFLFLSERTSAKDQARYRIMCLGDSITAGYTDNPKWQHPFEFGYRSHLNTLLTQAQHNFEFVGNSPEPWDGKWKVPSNKPKPDLRDLKVDKHRGYGGWNISGITQNVPKWIEQDKPDIILLLIGINGINAKSAEQLEALVKTIFASKKEVKLIVAQITPLKTFNQNLLNYNTFIKDKLVPSYSKQGKAISTVDLYSHFLKDKNDPKSIDITRLSNRINHPTNELYKKMAESWFKGIESALKAN